MGRVDIWRSVRLYGQHGEFKYVQQLLSHLTQTCSSNNANTPISPEVELLCSPRLARLCRIDHGHVDDLISHFNVLQVEHETTIIPGSATLGLNSAASVEATSASSTSTSSERSPAVVATGTADVDDERNSGESFDDGDQDWGTSDTDAARDSDSDRDYTACSADDCGYCGKCGY